MQIFKELKVIELASVLAGPAVGMFFAELGAEVIKIENPATCGDVTRSWKLPSEASDASESAYFHAVNYAKKHYFYDLRTNKQIIYELVAQADVVIANFKNASAKSLGMDAATLRGLNPRLIYASIHGFEADDNQPAFDVVLQAEAGFMYMTGERGGKAVKMPVALIDVLAAHQLKEGVLAALWQRERTCKGATVSVSLYESAIASLVNQATNWLIAGQIPQRMGSEHPNIAPYGDVMTLANGTEFVLAIGTEKQWKNLCNVLNINDLCIDERFKTNFLRVQHRAALIPILTQAIQQLDPLTAVELLQKKDVPVGVIRNMRQVFEHPIAQAMILHEGKVQKVKSVVFNMKE